jgi:protoheme IX farnesyltransferase
MLPITHGVEFTRLQIFLYTVILCICSVLPFVTYMSGVVYLVGVIALDIGFVYHALRLQWDPDDEVAMQTFRYSIIYLMALFGLLFADHYLPW